MDTNCDKALALLEQGWDDGLEEAAFRQAAAHLAACADCSAKVRAWSRVDFALKALADTLDRAEPETAISGRVVDALARARAIPAQEADHAAERELELFLTRLVREAALREQLARTRDPARRLEVMVDLARQQGFRFTEATVRQTLMRHQAANDGELSDEQLEAVAGGVSPGAALLRELFKQV